MKKFRLFLLLVVSALFAFALAACGEEEPAPAPPATQTITGVTFEDKTVPYDGNEHEITVTGTLPEGVSVAYTDNKGTAAGTYNATAVLSGEGYTTLTLHATLTIEGKTITGVTFTGDTVTYDGSEHEITVTGTLPEGVSVAYTNNKGTDAGTYNATAVLTGTGYNPLTLTATLTINKADIDVSGITFNDLTVTYNGQAHTLTATGLDGLPAGVTSSYSANTLTDAGELTVTLTIGDGGKNYNTWTKAATLTVEKATITGVTLDGKTVTYHEGTHYSLTLTGDVPAGVNVAWTNNDQTEAGSYTVTATLTGKNYETLTLTATLRILPNLSQLASTVMDAFGSVPDVWEFLPDSFRLNEARAYTDATAIDFTTAQDVSAIPTTGIGKQLDVVYGTVVRMQDLLGYVNRVYASANTIAGLYQTFINANPDNYREFSGATGEGSMQMQFRILLEDERYTLLVEIGSVAVEMYADANEEHYTGRVQITDTNALKFEVRENSLKIALEIIGTAMTQLEFVRNGQTVVGYLYECLDTEVADHALTFSTSALLTWSGKYVTVSGTNGDFIPGFEGSLVEVYDADTGRFLGSEVKEEQSVATFNTYWFPLADFSGIDTVRAVKKEGAIDTDLNSYTVYVNGAEFKTQTMGVKFGTKALSRRYDIEMKKIYLYTYDSDTKKFDKISMEIPMLFVQAEVYDELEGDVKKNSNLTGFKCNVSAAVVAEISSAYQTQLPAYEEIKDLLTPEMITTYVGSKNSWFA